MTKARLISLTASLCLLAFYFQGAAQVGARLLLLARLEGWVVSLRSSCSRRLSWQAAGLIRRRKRFRPR